MGKTYTYSDILAIVSRNVNRTIEDHLAPVICNMANGLIWNRYDWRESIEELPPFYLIPFEQDHGPPLVVVPDDFQGLRRVNLTQLSAEPPRRIPLNVLQNLEITHICSLPHAISFDRASKTFRVYPRVPGNIGSPDWIIEGTYKTTPPKITADKLNTTLPFDDMYVNVWIETMRWAALKVAGDERAGGVTDNNGIKVYTGQLAAAIAAIDQMAENEGLNLGDVALSPTEALWKPFTISGFWF